MTPHKMYRLAYTMDRPELRGQPVVFLGYVERPWDIRRAKVKLIRGDSEWLVAPGLVIPF